MTHYPPTVSNGVVYLGTNDGTLSAVDTYFQGN
jgi:hypothetical protein